MLLLSIGRSQVQSQASCTGTEGSRRFCRTTYQGLGEEKNIKIDLKNMSGHQKIEPLFSVLEIGWEAISVKCRTIFLDLVLHHIEDVCNLAGKYLWQFEDWTGNNGQERNSGSWYVQICKWVHFIIHLFDWHVCAQGEVTPSYYITICPVNNCV